MVLINTVGANVCIPLGQDEKLKDSTFTMLGLKDVSV